MEILLAIAVIVTILCSAYYLNEYTKQHYLYRILSIGGVGVSFVGMVLMLLSYQYFQTNQMNLSIVTGVVGITPYLCMFWRDYKKTNICIAIAALLIRLCISAILIFIILWFFYGKNDPMNEVKNKLNKIEEGLKR